MSSTVTKLSLQSVNETQLKTAAALIAKMLRGGEVVLLSGDLGAGKTTFARVLIQTLCGEATPVASPTFMLTQSYVCPLFTLQHYDLYRIKHPSELVELGVDEAIGRDVVLVEWPEIAGEYDWGQELITITFGHHSETTRDLQITAKGAMVAGINQMKERLL